MRISSQYKLLKHTSCNNTHDYINLFLGKYYKFSLMMFFFMVTRFTSEILQGLGKMRVWNMHFIDHQSFKDVSCNIIGFSWVVWKKCSMKCFIVIMKILVLVEAETGLFSNYIEIKTEKSNARMTCSWDASCFGHFWQYNFLMVLIDWKTFTVLVFRMRALMEYKIEF